MTNQRSKQFGYRDNRDRIWIVLRDLKTCSLDDIEVKTRINRDTIKSFLQSLTKAGYLEHSQPAPKEGTGNRRVAGVYTLIKDIGVETPKINKGGEVVSSGDKREQMWRTMKMLVSFSFKDLAINASTDDCLISESDAKSYCNNMVKAGYLVVTKKGTRLQQTRYRFLKSKNTGPKPPVVRKVTQIFDANIDEVMYQSGGGS